MADSIANQRGADIYDGCRKDLKPRGLGFSARIVSYVDGIIGDIGLF